MDEGRIEPGKFTINVSQDLIPTAAFASLESDSAGRWVGSFAESDIPLRLSGWFVEELDERPDLVVATRIEPDPAGRPVIVEVRVFPSAWVEAGPIGAWGLFAQPPHDVEGITARALRKVSIRRPLADTKKIIVKIADSDEYTESPAPRLLQDMGWSLEALQKALSGAPRRPGRKGRPTSFYLKIADAYASRVASGNRKPIATLASELDLKPAQVRDLVRQCRNRGLLTKGQRGVADGALTERALRLLEELEGEDNDGEHS